MEKQKILAISHKEDYICYKLEKRKSYYDFLFSLLKEFKIKIPDLYDETGKLPDILKEEDTHSYYNSDTLEVIEIIGHKSIFLIFKTRPHEKLTKFMEENCEFLESEEEPNN